MHAITHNQTNPLLGNKISRRKGDILRKNAGNVCRLSVESYTFTPEIKTQ